MAEKQVPTWQDYSGQVAASRPERIPAPFAGGTPTMRNLEMQSANARHAADLAAQMAMHRDKMSLEQQKMAFNQMAWQMEHDLALMEKQAVQQAEIESQAIMSKITSPLSPGQQRFQNIGQGYMDALNTLKRANPLGLLSSQRSGSTAKPQSGGNIHNPFR